MAMEEEKRFLGAAVGCRNTENRQSDVTFTGTWRYVPAPRLVIEKSISLQSDQLTGAHGAPCFLFRITGASSGKVWYRSVSFRSDSVAKAKTAADGSEKIYRDQDGNTFRIDGDVLRASCPAIRLPEDDYLVEELDPLRFPSGAVRKRLRRRFRMAAG